MLSIVCSLRVMLASHSARWKRRDASEYTRARYCSPTSFRAFVTCSKRIAPSSCSRARRRSSGAQELGARLGVVRPQGGGLARRRERLDLEDRVVLHAVRDPRPDRRVAQRPEHPLHVAAGLGDQPVVPPQLGAQGRQPRERPGDRHRVTHRNGAEVVEHELHARRRVVGCQAQRLRFLRHPQRRRPVLEVGGSAALLLDAQSFRRGGEHPPLRRVEVDRQRDLVGEQGVAGPRCDDQLCRAAHLRAPRAPGRGVSRATVGVAYAGRGTAGKPRWARARFRASSMWPVTFSSPISSRKPERSSATTGWAWTSDRTTRDPSFRLRATRSRSACRAVESIAGTWRIRRIRTLGFPTIRPSRSLNISAAPKKNGPLISYTSTPSGTTRRRTALGSLSKSSTGSRNSCVSALMFVTSAMRRMNRNAASTIPTSIATVRSTSTVRRKVASSTATSLLGARSSERNVRHSLMR